VTDRPIADGLQHLAAALSLLDLPESFELSLPDKAYFALMAEYGCAGEKHCQFGTFVSSGHVGLGMIHVKRMFKYPVLSAIENGQRGEPEPKGFEFL
jgi:hypothetical protein